MGNKTAKQLVKNARRTFKKRIGKRSMIRNNKSIFKQSAGMTTKDLSNEPIVVGLVYANWCPHCTHMKPEWNKMKKELQGDDQYNVVEIEADQPDKQKRLAELETGLNGKTIEAAGYPTIFKINNGEVEYYGGERNLNDMKYWATGGQVGGFEINKQRKLNRRNPNNLTPKRTPFAKSRASKVLDSKPSSKFKTKF